jgi:PKD repeat protein
MRTLDRALGDLGYTLPTETIAPVAGFQVNVLGGVSPLTVTFSDQSTNEPTAWEWDFQNDGGVDSTSRNPSFTYTEPGLYSVRLTVRNTAGSNTLLKSNLLTIVNPTPSALLVYWKKEPLQKNLWANSGSIHFAYSIK